MYMHVHSSITYNIDNSPKVDPTEVSINRWMDKQIVVYPIMEYDAAIKKDGYTDTSNNVDEP